MGTLGTYLPVPLVAALIAFIYGKGIGHKWVPAIITFVCTMAGGLSFNLLIRHHSKLRGLAGVGQIAGVVISAVIIFLLFTLPAQRKAAQKENEKTQSLFNEEDT